MADHLCLVFSTSFAWQSGVIRLMCHSPYSHCDVMVEDPVPHGLLGASDPGGVMVRSHDYQPFKAWRKATIKTDKADKVIELVKSQIGKPFDASAMHHVISEQQRDWKQPDAWFCSELICWALEEAGFFPYRLIVPKNRVTPADLLLLLNPYIDIDDYMKAEGVVLEPVSRQHTP